MYATPRASGSGDAKQGSPAARLDATEFFRTPFPPVVSRDDGVSVPKRLTLHEYPGMVFGEFHESFDEPFRTGQQRRRYRTARASALLEWRWLVHDGLRRFHLLRSPERRNSHASWILIARFQPALLVTGRTSRMSTASGLDRAEQI